MRNILITLLLFLFWSCTACNSGENADSDKEAVLDKDSTANVDTDLSDNPSDEVSTESEVLTDTDGINTDIDSPKQDHDVVDKDTQPDESNDIELPDYDYPAGKDGDPDCPSLLNAGFPYKDGDGTIHFCRPCDTPDEYDPQCVKSLWKDVNKEVYDMYMNGEFEDNEYVVECYPWPCEWDVTPTPRVPESTSVHKCDIFLNPRTWANSFSGFRRESNMDGGKIVFQTDNYRIGDKKPVKSDPGYEGQRAVLYDIKTGKYEVIGKSVSPYYMSGHILINPYITVNKKGFKPIVGPPQKKWKFCN